jgi:Tfp pilus assembly protein PilF
VRRLVAGFVAALCVGPAGAAAADCENWVADVVSVQGAIQTLRAGQAPWRPVGPGDRLCLGDALRVLERGRAALRLRNGAMLRLDQNTTVTFSGPQERPGASVELLRGIVHFTSRISRGLKVLTPFVNGTVQGTEFWVEVDADRTLLSVFEGRLVAENPAGRIAVESGQSAVARSGQAPTPLVIVRPRDAVQWALYYPTIATPRVADFPDTPGQDWPAMVRKSIEAFRKADFVSAFASLETAPPDTRDPRFFTYRALLLLAVGRVDEARRDIERAMALDRNNGHALALQSVMAVARNDKDEALRLARLAVGATPQAAAPWVALSYAQQASFDLEGALASLQEAVRLEPDAGLVWARLAEIWLAFGQIAKARAAAAEAVRFGPELARAQTAVGFTLLADLQTTKARQAFERAIRLDQADPLPRLGLGLARIRRGELDAGRAELEAASSLDPDNSLVRSYLGKAYYEERRSEPAAEQFAAARTLDLNDPTPWFYDAILKHSLNRPIEALHDLQRAIELNDNRAIYRSRMLLDEDLATRSVSLARVYDDLGFQQLALAEAWKSLGIDPGNYSAHRFLSDAYSTLPRHDIARVSELLQAQLLQPLNIDPVQPRLAASNLFILSGAGPADPAFNEYNALFNRNRLSLQLSGLYGGNRTFGDEVVHSAVLNDFAYSLGQFYYETRGFRPNNDLKQEIYNVFAQARLSRDTSVQAEVRSQFTEKGDLQLRFDPENFLDGLRQTEKFKSWRVGLRHAFEPGSELLVSVIGQTARFRTKVDDFVSLTTDEDGVTGEIQHIARTQRLSLISGAGHFSAERKDQLSLPFLAQTDRASVRHTNLYLYALLHVLTGVTVTVGASGDFFEGGVRDRDQINPKAGIMWTPLPGTTLRAAAFRTFKRPLLTNQTIEPTQVAGFNQFFDDAEATDSWRYGVGIDQKFSANVYAGAEASRRTSEVPFTVAAPEGTLLRKTDWIENLGRGYLYWTPTYWLALSAEYEYERLQRDLPLDEGIADVRTHRVPLAVAFFDPSGFRARVKATFMDQKGTFADPGGELRHGDDRFWVVDASIGYRLPGRWGLVTIEARNLFDKRFHYQETDPVTPRIYPERLILGRFTVAY